MQTKIIHLAAPTDKRLTPENSPGSYYQHSWAATIARRIKQRYPDLDVETWRTDWHLESVSTVEEKGLYYRHFPMHGSFLNHMLSYRMCKELWQLSKTQNLILHYHDIYDLVAVLLPIIVPKAKIVLFHHGGIPPNSGDIKGNVRNRLFRFNSNKYRYISYLNKATQTYLEQQRLGDKIGFIPVGADYDYFNRLTKAEARKMLGIGQHEIIVMAVGQVAKLKGADLLYEAVKALQCEFNIRLVFVGPNVPEEQDLYRKLLSINSILPGYVTWPEMPKYFSACDFFVHPIFFDTVGFDVSLLEALASNRPVVSSRIDILDCRTEDIGVFLKSRNELKVKMEYMIKNFPQYTSVRACSIGKYDANTAIVDSICRIYTEHCGMVNVI